LPPTKKSLIDRKSRMAIAAKTRPSVVVTGVVTSTREARKKDDNSIYAHDVLVAAGAGNLYVRYWTRSITEGARLPLPGANVAVVVTVDENERNGSSLNFERELTPEDVNFIVEASPALATAK
jgi:hypothetical protein